MEKDLFLIKLHEIENQYQDELNKQKSFNIVRAFHKIDDERRLHSRFIAYLLSPKSKHSLGDAFLRKFIALIPQLKDFDLVGDIEIFPNEDKKKEKYNIDILIINKTTKQAIIIENKINAKDSNRKNKIKQDSQIDDSISTYSNNEMEDIAQLKTYFYEIKNTEEFGFKYENELEALNKIQLIYLTLNKKNPSLKEQFNGFNLTLIDYRTEIKQWLENCINNEEICNFLEESSFLFLKEILRQYLDITIQLTNNVKRALDLKELISKDIDFAWKNECIRNKIYNMSDFIHVKWHTVFDFWNELTAMLEKDAKIKIVTRISIKEITKQIYYNKIENVKKRIDRKSYGIVININEKLLYIMNDNNNGLTFGFKDNIRKDKDKDWFSINEDVKFSEFKDETSFKLIEESFRANFINIIIEDIHKHTN